MKILFLIIFIAFSIFFLTFKVYLSIELILKDINIRFYTLENNYIKAVSDNVQKVRFLKNSIEMNINNDFSETKSQNPTKIILSIASDLIEDHYNLKNNQNNVTNSMLFLVNEKKEITYSSMQYILDLSHYYTNIIDLSNRDYLVQDQKELDVVHIGSLVKGAITGNWVVPVSTAISYGNPYYGSIISTLPLSEFSKENTLSDIQFSSIYVQNVQNKLDQKIHEDKKLDQVLSFHQQSKVKILDLLHVLFTGKSNKVHLSYDLSSFNQIIYVDIEKTDLKSKIFRELVLDLVVIFTLITFSLLLMFIVEKSVFQPLKEITNIISVIAPKFSLLEKDMVLKSNETDLRILENGSEELRQISDFVNKSANVIDYAQNLSKKDLQFQSLYQKFLEVFKMKKETHILLAEEIKDLMESVKMNEAKELLFKSLSELYDVNDREKTRVDFLDDFMHFIMKTTSVDSQEVYITDVIKNHVKNFNHVTVESSPTSKARLLFLESFHHSIDLIFKILFEQDKDWPIKISISEEEGGVKVEFIKIFTEDQKYTNDLSSYFSECLYKARMFTLINSGIINLYLTKQEVVITLFLK